MVVEVGKSYRGKQGRIGYILRQAQHNIRLKIDAALKDLNMTHPQFVVLSILEYEEEIHAADIARISMFSAQATNVIINKLEANGLIKRMPHETHGRVLTTHLTKKGQKCLQQCKDKVYAIEDQMVQGMSAKQEAQIRDWLIQCTQI